MSNVPYSDNGIILSKKTLHSGDKISIIYNGLLVQAGADSIFAHLGYGDKWENSAFIPMKHELDKFSADIEIQEGKSLCICFKDAADNWDNNSGENYIFKISKKPERKAKEPIKAAAVKKPKEKKAKVKDSKKI